MIEIWFEPHATSLDNEAGLASGWNDVDLSDTGREQARQPIERSRERGIEAVFTSDLQRAIKTGAPTAQTLRLPLYVDERLRECDYGKLTQAPKSEVDALKKTSITTPYPDGESFEVCMMRMGAFLTDLRQKFDGKTIMIVGHRATQYGLEHHILGKSVEQCVTEPWQYQPGWRYELQ